MIFIDSYKFANLLLDNDPATVAYSLRKLRTDYTGSAIRVRRSSDNAETDIGFLDNVLDTVTLLSFCGAGDGFLVTWYDQSGGGYNFNQPTYSLQPLVVSSGVIATVNSKPSIYGTIGKYLVQEGQSKTVSTFNIVGQMLAGGQEFQTFYSYRTTIGIVNGSITSNLSTISNDTTLPYNIFANGTATSAYIDGTAVTSLPDFNNYLLGISMPTSLTIITQTINTQTGLMNGVMFIDVAGRAMVGYISEYIVFPNALSTTDRQNIERNQGSFYTITVP